MTGIVPNLWFDGRAEEAADFYTSLFPDSRIDSVMRAGAETPGNAEGDVIVVAFTLSGQRFAGINGGPQFPFTEAVSFAIECDGQAEVDRYWDALIADGGEPSRCGWLKDRFGLSWQVVPNELGRWLGGPDPTAPAGRPRRCSRWRSSTSRRSAGPTRTPRRTADRRRAAAVSAGRGDGRRREGAARVAGHMTGTLPSSSVSSAMSGAGRLAPTVSTGTR